MRKGEPLSPVEEAWAHYEAVSRDYDAAEEVERRTWGKSGETHGTPRNTAAWIAASEALERASRARFGAYDRYAQVKKKRDRELRVLVRDGLEAGIDGLPLFAHSLDRLTTEMVAFLVNGEQIEETDMSPAPLCAGCREEMMAA